MNDKWMTLDRILLECELNISMPTLYRRAKKEAWEYRTKEGTKGIAHEYNTDALPLELRLILLKKQNQVETSAGPVEIKPANNPERQHLWNCWEKATTKQREKAQHCMQAVSLMHELVESGICVRTAANSAGASLGISANTLRTWYRRAVKFPRCDWLPALLNKQLTDGQTSAPRAAFDDAAWDFIYSDYMRLERPTLTACYERLKLAAKTNGWAYPSLDTIQRRINTIPMEVRILKREGEHALHRVFPAQQRTVADLHAMQWINGDGYHHNVRVIWHNGEELRPKTWFWQDVYSRRILAWYTDVSENSDSIRYSLLDLIRQYGKPEHATIDNTRAAANKNLTGGVPNRYRFKVKDDDICGILPMLGINVNWTGIVAGKGWGQAKPVERAFGVGAMEEFVDKHPLCAGAWTGPNPTQKPDYKVRPVSADDFLMALEEGIAMFNAKVGRNTEMCAGQRSFDQAFQDSYARHIHQFLPEQQLRMLMLSTEGVTVKTNGTFTVKAGGKIQSRENRYYSPELRSMRSHKVAVRFDPRNLHGNVYCYTLDGEFLCEAECLEAVAFGDTQAAREHKRMRTQMVKSVKRSEEAQQRMTMLELAELMGETTPPAAPERPVVGLFTEGNTVRKTRPAQQVEEEEETDIEDIRLLRRYLEAQEAREQDE